MTWRYMSRLYLLVPIITLIFLAALFLLITFAWLVSTSVNTRADGIQPPDRHQREAGQPYPHPFFWKPLLIGIFASCTAQTIRLPTWVVVASVGLPPALITFLCVLHTIATLLKLR